MAYSRVASMRLFSTNGKISNAAGQVKMAHSSSPLENTIVSNIRYNSIL